MLRVTRCATIAVFSIVLASISFLGLGVKDSFSGTPNESESGTNALGPPFPQGPMIYQGPPFPQGPMYYQGPPFPQGPSNAYGPPFPQGATYSYGPPFPQGVAYSYGPPFPQGPAYSYGPPFPQGPGYSYGPPFPQGPVVVYYPYAVPYSMAGWYGHQSPGGENATHGTAHHASPAQPVMCSLEVPQGNLETASSEEGGSPRVVAVIANTVSDCTAINGKVEH